MANMLKKLGNVAQKAKDKAGELLAQNDSEVDDGGVEELLERISDGVLAEDRRAAMSDLRDKVAENAKAQVALGDVGLPIMLTVLREERNDVELVRGALETLYNTVTAVLTDVSEGFDPCRLIAERFCHQKDNVSLLLSLLEDEDFYVRYHTVQLMTELISKAPKGYLQEAILANPTGMSRLMDMLSEREVIRNETLLLLTALTKTNEDIKKILVFDGAFDRLFVVIREEGGVDGGIVVQDCLALLANLLRENNPNQVFFRESSFLKLMPQFLQLSISVDVALPAQKAANLLGVLECVKLCTAAALPANERKTNQTVLATNGVLDPLLSLALHCSSPAVSAEALWALGDLVAAHAENQNLLGNAMVEGKVARVPALNRVLALALAAPLPRQSTAALHVFDTYCHGNNDGQLLLASTIMPVGPESEAEHDDCRTFGSVLVRSFLGTARAETVGATSRAALVLVHLLAGSSAAKERMLHVPLEESQTSSADFLLPRVVRFLMSAAELQENVVLLQGAMLRLLVTWLSGCPRAVSSFLASPAHLPAVVELANSRSVGSVHVRGLASLVLGACVVHNEVAGDLDGAAVIDVITERVGMSTFYQNLQAIQDSSDFKAALKPPASVLAVARGGEPDAAPAAPSAPLTERDQVAVLYDHEFAKWVVGFWETMGQAVQTMYARPKQAAPTHTKMWEVGEEGDTAQARLDRAHALIRTQELEMAELRGRNVSLAERLIANAQGGGGGGGEGGCGGEDMQAALASLADKNKTKQVQLEAEFADHKAESAAALAAATAEIEELKAAAAAKEEEMKALSEAYNGLESGMFAHEETERALRAQLTAAEERAKAAEAAAGGAAVSATTAEGLAAAREEGYAAAVAEWEPKVEAAREEATAAAEEAGEAEMNDLLVCLGQEESKTERLRNRLEELGEDVDELLASVGIEEEDGNDDDDEGATSD